MSFEDLLKSLQVDYIRALPSKIESIRTLIAANDAVGLREAFHKFKGTGRTYGLPEVSELAEAVERICADHPPRAARAAELAAEILHDVHAARGRDEAFALASDARYLEIRKLLQA